MKADVILRAHGLAKDAVILALVPAPVPVPVPVLVPVLVLVRVVIISAQLPALSLVLAVAAVRVVEIPVVPNAQIAAWEPAKAIVLEAAEPAVEDALHPVHQAVRAIVAGPAGISVSDRRLHRYINLIRRKI